MPKSDRTYRPNPHSKAIKRFGQALKDVTREDVASFKSTCRRSWKGNLYLRFHDGTCVTVFRRLGVYRLCIVSPDFAPHYPPGSFECEEEAIEALLDILDSVYELEWRGDLLDAETAWMG